MASPDPPQNRHNLLRLWGALDLVYGLALIGVVVTFVPWKLPTGNVLVLAYLGLHVVTAPGLWRQQRWAWRTAVVTSLMGLAFGFVVITGLVMSWAYLRGVYGSFGQGASLVALMLAATAFQLLSLYPALRLKALLRARREGSWRKSATGIVAALALLPLVLAVGVQEKYTLGHGVSLEDGQARTLLTKARQCLQTQHCEPSEKAEDHAGLVFLSLFDGGRMVARTQAQTVMQAARALAQQPGTAQHLGGRLKLDHELGHATLPSWPLALQSLGFEPGKDGLRVQGRKAGINVLPDDVIAADVAGAEPLLPFLPEVRLGVSPQWLFTQLNSSTADRLERFAVESWIECPQGNAAEICRVERGVVLLPPLDTKTAAQRAGHFIIQAQRPDGTFSYVYRPFTNTAPPSGYSVVRHAGTAYALAMLEALMPGQGFGASSERALEWLLLQAAPVCGGHTCVHERTEAKAGTNALTLLALVTHQQATGNRRWEKTALSVGQFLVSLQQPSGDLAPAFDIATGHVATLSPKQMFATEEASMALVSAGSILGEASLSSSAHNALGFLTKGKYADFLGRFSYGVDSWTCMAVAALPSSQVQANWIDFCLGYADFIGRLQFLPKEHDAAFAGHYGFSHVLIPQAPAAAGFAEALTAVLAVAKAHGRDVSKLEQQVTLALGALTRDQLRPGNDYLAPVPAQAWGGIRRSVVESEVRIDFVQHAASALARGHALGL